MTILYGIPNCDTIKKTQKWLIKNNITFTFHDYRIDGITPELVQDFISNLPLTELLNKRSTSYRNLSEDQKKGISIDNVSALFIEYPTLIKRPLLIHENKYYTGFKEATYQSLFLTED